VISKEQLLKQALSEEEVEVPGRGTVRVRSLSRLELIRVQTAPPDEAEALALSHGLIDPVLTLDEAYEALAASEPYALQPVTDAIMRLSGMTEGAQKSGRAGADARGGRPAPVHRGQGPGDDPG
jgi:hypothetical protein